MRISADAAERKQRRNLVASVENGHVHGVEQQEPAHNEPHGSQDREHGEQDADRVAGLDDPVGCLADVSITGGGLKGGWVRLAIYQQRFGPGASAQSERGLEIGGDKAPAVAIPQFGVSPTLDFADHRLPGRTGEDVAARHRKR